MDLSQQYLLPFLCLICTIMVVTSEHGQLKDPQYLAGTDVSRSSGVNLVINRQLPQMCKAKRKCMRKKGSCIPVSMTCEGKVIRRGCKKGKRTGCQCCVPITVCKAKRKCMKKKGSCIPVSMICEGRVIRRGCKKGKRTGCKCCVP
ncbi:unnamed protein product, partial [Meganyctiphanes norvegica]